MTVKSVYLMFVILHNEDAKEHVTYFLFLLKGPAADATEAPHP
jgi:hypothetical protein